jgi:DNA-binding MarR family transcriptional regulator
VYTTLQEMVPKFIMKMSRSRDPKRNRGAKPRRGGSTNNRAIRASGLRAKAQQPVPSIIAQWRREKPNFDTGPMALFGALARAFLLTSPVIEKLMSEYGVARGMFDVLAALRRAGRPYRLPPSRLSKWLMLSGAGMTNRLDRLEAMGLVVRQPEPNDRRSTRIQLTPKGLQLVEKLIPQLVELEKQIVADFGAANIKRLTQLLISFNNKLVEKH